MSEQLNTIQDFASKLRSKKTGTGQPNELKVDPHFEEDPEAAKVIEFAIKRRKNLLLVGPTGCGKSSLAINVMARLKETAEIFSCDGETCTDNLIGKPWAIIDDKGKGKTVVAPGAALRAYKEGKILLLEEVDHAIPDILASLHRIMETQSEFYISNIGDEEVIQKHRDFSVIATANTIGTGEDTYLYAGTKPLNMAFMNRFSLTFRMGYIDKSREIKVLKNRTGIDDTIAQKIVYTANDARDASDPSRINGAPGSAKLGATISTRDTIEWADAIVGMSLEPVKAAEYAFLNRISEIDRDVIRTMITNRF